MSKRMLTDKVAALQIVALSVLMLLGLASTAGAQVRGPDEVVDLIATVFVNWESRETSGHRRSSFEAARSW